MPAPKRQMKLGVSMIGLGYHVAAWRHPDVPADGSPNIRHSVEVAQTAERGKLDSIFFADSPAQGHDPARRPPGKLEPTVLLTVIALILNMVLDVVEKRMSRWSPESLRADEERAMT